MRKLTITAMAAVALGLKDGTKMRKMGMQETLWHNIDEGSHPMGCGLLTYSLVVDCKRRLEANDVQLALEALQKQVPILRARVKRYDDGLYMVSSNAPVCLTVLPPGGDFQQHHEDKVNNESVINDQGGPHWKAALLQEPTNTTAPATPSHRAALYLSIQHTFTDGLSQSLLLGQLVRNLDEVVLTGHVKDREPAPVYPALEELLKDKVPLSGSVAWQLVKTFSIMFRDRASALTQAYVVTPYYDAQIPENPCRVEMATWPPEKLTRLRAQCRQHGVTVNDALTAAACIAGARMLEKTPDGQTHKPPYTMRTIFIVNMRRYFSKDVDKSQLYMTSAGGAGSHVKVPSTSTSNFWPIAANVHASIMRQIDMKMPIVFMQRIVPLIFNPDKYNFDEEMEKAFKRTWSPADHVVNNLGSVDAVVPKTTAVKPVELHRTYRQHPGGDISFGAHLFQSIGGRLCYDFAYICGKVKQEHAKRFRDKVLDILDEVSDAEN